MHFGQRIKLLRTSKGLSQKELGEKAGMTAMALSAIENGNVENSRYLLNIAKALETTVDYLKYGKENTEVTQIYLPSGDVTITREIRFAPIITWSQAIIWDKAGEFISPSDPYNVVPLFGNESQHSFALIIKNNVMRSFYSETSFIHEDIIICDPSMTKPRNNAFVIVKIQGENEAVFKQFIKDGSRYFLVPLNPQFPAVEFNKNTMTICATVIRRITELTYAN